MAEKEYIEREALRDTLYEADAITMRGVAILNQFPAADVRPVVRCKDCDMWNEEDFSGRKSLGNYRCACSEWSNLEDGRRVYTGPDEFCSRGERKGGGEDEK